MAFSGDRNGRSDVSIELAMLEETMGRALDLVAAHGGFPPHGDVALTPEIAREVARHRARWSEATPTVRAAAAFLLAIEGMPDGYPVKILGVPVAVERLSLEAVVLVLAWEENWLQLDRDEAGASLADYGPALRRIGYDVAMISLERLRQACLALGHTPKPTLARRLLGARRQGTRLVYDGIRAVAAVSPARILTDAVRIQQQIAATYDSAARTAFREGVLAAVKDASKLSHKRLAVDIACALLVGTTAPSGHDRLEIAAAAGRMA